jgi:hypothetical protein
MVEGNVVQAERLFLGARIMIRAAGNALVWVALTVGLPGVLYAMTMVQEDGAQPLHRHRPERCSVCRYNRQTSLGSMPKPIEDENMILVSPAHPFGDHDEAWSDEPIP